MGFQNVRFTLRYLDQILNDGCVGTTEYLVTSIATGRRQTYYVSTRLQQRDRLNRGYAMLLYTIIVAVFIIIEVNLLYGGYTVCTDKNDSLLALRN